MIEIVARALAQRYIDRSNGRVTGSGYSSSRHMPESYMRDFRDDARAAINALREPSDKMLAAGVVHDDATYSTWIAMIDAALVEGE